MRMRDVNFEEETYHIDETTGKIYDESWTEVELALKNKILKNFPPRKKSLVYDELKSYGTNAKDIYQTLATWFGWRKDLSDKFIHKKRMKAEVCANLSIQFLPYNNINGLTEEIEYYNELRGDYLTITAPHTWAGFIKDTNDVLVFVNKDEDGYYFYGVYEYESSHSFETEYKKRYVRKSKIYPKL